MYITNALVFKEGRILIPKNIQLELIEQLHIGHQGVNSMKNNARHFFLACRGSTIAEQMRPIQMLQ